MTDGAALGIVSDGQRIGEVACYPCVFVHQLVHARHAVLRLVLWIVHFASLVISGFYLWTARHAARARTIPVRAYDIHCVHEGMANGAQLPVQNGNDPWLRRMQNHIVEFVVPVNNAGPVRRDVLANVFHNLVEVGMRAPQFLPSLDILDFGLLSLYM
ncbi:hypothetical protein JI435_303210 [Parastagonospora nodorum SN15]|uniref:Uncharacterized protein n=1 Tax=Phaeosphaeria nodorum (strain SN15 / ATCC MYA-4574 / FGSC 10173) TaxID=321614 RepID=A0A7U2F4M5_PHANO|nr:hypothetical protein JI435_303210 [Parastagonospora nodorum SN15]